MNPEERFKKFCEMHDELAAEVRGLRTEVGVLSETTDGIYELGHTLLAAVEDAAKRGMTAGGFLHVAQQAIHAWREGVAEVRARRQARTG
jgi:hypothetical protein